MLDFSDINQLIPIPKPFPGVESWILNALADAGMVDLKFEKVQALSGDASFRRYFRLLATHENELVNLQPSASSLMLAVAPPQTEKNHEFVSISQLLNGHNVLASEVIAVDYEHGLILQHDLGDQELQPLLSSAEVEKWYNLALDQLVQLATLPKQSVQVLPAYNREALLLELNVFREWFVEHMLAYSLNETEHQMIDDCFDLLIARACQQEQVFVHRDYHCRNIMVTADEQLAVIDFQDALYGPITYDAVSLWRDCYVVWPESLVNGFVERFYKRLKGERVIASTKPLVSFKKDFDLMGLQRHVKVLGVFARLSLRDDKHTYLADLPAVVAYVRSILSLYNEKPLQVFADWFEIKLMPLVELQSWWLEPKSKGLDHEGLAQ